MEEWIGLKVGSFSIQHILGSGRTGQMYQAFDPQVRQQVAVKVLNPHLSAQRQTLEDLAKQLMRLKHPGLIRILDYGRWRDQSYLVMDYLSGPTLRHVIKDQGGDMSWPDIFKIGGQVADALNLAHSHGILHLNLRPENIFFSQHGTSYQAVIEDLGLGQLIDIADTYRDATAENLAYLSPEQCAPKSATLPGASDVYTLGIILYEMITGQPPFKTPNIEQAVARHTRDRPRPVTSYRLDTPPEVESLVTKMLDKNHTDRPDMLEVARQLQAARKRSGLTRSTNWESLARLRKAPAPAPAPVVLPSDEVTDDIETVRGVELHVSQKGEETRVFTLQEGQSLTAGRRSNCDIVLKDRRISGRHCSISLQKGQVMVIDLGSSNGTLIGDAQLLPHQPQPLRPGLAIRVRPFSIQVAFHKEPDLGTQIDLEEPEPGLTSMAAHVNIRLNRDIVEVIPGGIEPLVVNFENLSNLVDHYSVRVFGIPDDWTELSEDMVQLNPGQQGSIRVLFQPPPLPTTTAGKHPIRLFVRSREQNRVVAEANAILVVGPFHRFEASLSRSQVETRTRANLGVAVENRGNAESVYYVTARDDSEALMFEVETGDLRLASGASQTVNLKVAPKKPNWIGAPKFYSFSVTVDSSTADPKTLMAQFRQKAWLPSWLPMVLMLLCCLLLALLLAFGRDIYDFFFPPTLTPTLTITPTSTPTYTPTLIPSSTPTLTPTPDLTATWVGLDDDHDGLLNADELTWRTDPLKPDTDGDGLTDGEEVREYQTDPTKKDTDNDTWLDGEEVALSNERFPDGNILCPNPTNPDSDADGQVDRQDPDPCDLPTPTPTITPSVTPVRNFGLGGQVHTQEHSGEMLSAGMTWVKRQVKFDPQSPGNLAEEINFWHGNQFKVLLSVIGYKEHLVDGGVGYYDAYASFVAGLAESGADAIEVWNEMNIDAEWPAGQINPGSYTQLLARAYTAIKSRNPATLVISGAPAPTGVDDSVHVWADNRYIQGMAAANADNYADCIGIHFNAGTTPPDETTGGPGDHYSWYYQTMVDTYWDAFDGAKPLCFTELGYLSGDGLDPLPPGFEWALGTSVFEQAEWLGEAVTMAYTSGKVRLVIIWNIDFQNYGSNPGDDPQAGYAILRPDKSCPACGKLMEAMAQASGN